MHPELIHDGSIQVDTAQRVRVIRPEDTRLTAIRVIHSQFSLIERHARNRSGVVLHVVPRYSFTLRVRRPDISHSGSQFLTHRGGLLIDVHAEDCLTEPAMT